MVLVCGGRHTHEKTLHKKNGERNKRRNSGKKTAHRRRRNHDTDASEYDDKRFGSNTDE